jgi:hypothetical protein
MIMQNVMIDWLQIYGTTNDLIEAKNYTYRQQNYQTKQFRKIIEVYKGDEEYATITMHPTSPIIPSDAVIIKLKNRQLYVDSAIDEFSKFLTAANIIYKSITRVDIAVDLNYFTNKLHPEAFIRHFLTNKFLKQGRGKFTVIGEQKQENSYQYLKFGSKTSDVSVYLYNKSIELMQVQDKPYIRKSWALNGLDTTKDVWRLEISIKGNGTHFLNKNTGELNRIQFMNLDSAAFLKDIYEGYANHFFRFVINDGKSNITRMKHLELLNIEDTYIKPYYLPNETGNNKTDKIFAKKLYLLDSEIRGLNDSSTNSIKEIFADFIKQTNLTDYVADRSINWNRLAKRQY